MANPHNLILGQEVIVKPLNNDTRYHKEPFVAKITKVGKKYFEVTGLYNTQFTLDDLYEKHKGYGYGHDFRVYLSQQQIDDEFKHNDYCKRIKVMANAVNSLSLEKVIEIHNLLKNSFSEKTKNGG